MKALEMFILFLLHALNIHFETSDHEKLHSFDVWVDSLEEGINLANQMMVKARCLYMGEIAIHRTLYNGIGDEEKVQVARRYDDWEEEWYSSMRHSWKETDFHYEQVELWISTEEITFLLFFHVR